MYPYLKEFLSKLDAHDMKIIMNLIDMLFKYNPYPEYVENDLSTLNSAIHNILNRKGDSL